MAVIVVGPLTLNTVMLLMVLTRWACQLLFGSFPSFLSKLIMAWGLWTVLDPLAVFVVDTFLGVSHLKYLEYESLLLRLVLFSDSIRDMKFHPWLQKAKGFLFVCFVLKLNHIYITNHRFRLKRLWCRPLFVNWLRWDIDIDTEVMLKRLQWPWRWWLSHRKAAQYFETILKCSIIELLREIN